MKKFLTAAFISSLFFICNAHAQQSNVMKGDGAVQTTIVINYSGKPITLHPELSYGDTITINANANTGSKVMIRIRPLGVINSSLFTFTSNLPGAPEKRFGDFTDTMVIGTGPQSVLYTYTGQKQIFPTEVDVYSN